MRSEASITPSHLHSMEQIKCRLPIRVPAPQRVRTYSGSIFELQANGLYNRPDAQWYDEPYSLSEIAEIAGPLTVLDDGAPVARIKLVESQRRWKLPVRHIEVVG